MAKAKKSTGKWTFDGDQVLSQPGFTYDVLAVINHVEVTGGKPQHSKVNAKGSASLPDVHPLSPVSLSRNGKKRYMTAFYQNDSLKSKTKCNAKAKSILAEHDSQGVTASFDCLPIPHLEEKDQITLSVDGYQFTFPLEQWTLPLTPDTTMSVGATKDTTNPARKKN